MSDRPPREAETRVLHEIATVLTVAKERAQLLPTSRPRIMGRRPRRVAASSIRADPGYKRGDFGSRAAEGEETRVSGHTCSQLLIALE